MTRSDIIYLEQVHVDVGQQRILTSSGSEKLTSRELQLLLYLVSNQRRTIPREELLVEVWGFSPTSMTRAVDNMVRKLRSKLEQDPKNPVHIHTVHGEGYRFEPGHVAAQPAPSGPTEPSVSAQEHNLEPLRTEFVGRSREIDAVREAFVASRNVVTVVGPSGMGKSTLATVMGHRLLKDGQRNSVWFIRAANALNRDDLLEEISHSLHMGSKETDRARESDTPLRCGAVLLILDNVEQVLDAAADCIELFSEMAPNAQFLITSQHKLGIRGEVLVRIGQLGLEDAKQLFFTRLRDAGLLDEDDPPEAREVDTLMDLLGGVPFALELAVSSLAVFSISQLNQRFGQHREVLGLIDTMKGERHQSLRAAISWSWSLLSPQERRVTLIVRCFVVDLRWMQSLMEHSKVPLRVHPILRQLRDKSILHGHTTPPPNRVRHLVLFQAIRAYGLEQLATLGSAHRRKSHL